MAAKDPPSFEAEQEVLAVRLHRFEATPVKARCDTGRTCAWMHSLDGQPLANESA